MFSFHIFSDNVAYEMKDRNTYYFSIEDLLFPSNSHHGGVYKVHAKFTVKCAERPKETMRSDLFDSNPIFINLIINGREITDLHNACSYLLLIHSLATHTSLHLYCTSISKLHLKHSKMSESSIIAKMVSTSTGLNEAANW